VRHIGHLNYVRPGAEALWDATLRWLRAGGTWPMGSRG
jgi:predicted alpha/beta hydrolase